MEKIKGRGAQHNTPSRFIREERGYFHHEAIDEYIPWNEKTQFFKENPKTVLNRNSSPDIPFTYSINPYQGCEHGCAYCYARNVHEYWGYSAGLDFEQKIIYKPNAPSILRQHFDNINYVPESISLSGNTDCYQPAERKFEITRKLLEVFLEYRHPVGIITKNSLVLRDIDLLEQMARLNLVHVILSVTTLDESLKQVMEPRTASITNRLKTIRKLNDLGIPTGVMVAPVIPGLNSDEIPSVIRECAVHGARVAGYTLLRLNGSVSAVFKKWLENYFPDRFDKVWHQVEACHGGAVNDSRFGKRMTGEGPIAESIRKLFKISVNRYLRENRFPEYDFSLFRRPGSVCQLAFDF
jgi:DNA repair photolyase